MALLWVEGFEQFGADGDGWTQEELLKKYCNNYTADISLAAGRYGGTCLHFRNISEDFVTPLLTSNETLIVGFAYKADDNTTNTFTLVSIRPEFGTGTVANLGAIEVRQTPNYAIHVRNQAASSTLGTTVNDVLTPNAWQYIEVKVKHGSSGNVSIRVDEIEVLSLNSVNTAFYTTIPNGVVGFRADGAASVNRYFDDIYICDGSGNSCNDFLGSCRVLTKYPDSDGTGNFTANSGSDKYAMVNNAGTINTVNYCTISDDGEQLFGFDSLASGNIHGIQLNSTQNCTGNKTYATRIIADDGTRANGETLPVYEQELENYKVWEVDPSGNTWTPATLNATQFGVESL